MLKSRDMAPLGSLGSVFWNNQFRTKIAFPDPKTLPALEGKTAVITGANSGLGFEAAKQLLALGLSRLIIAVRSVEKGESAASSLRNASPAARVDVWLLDMRSYDSIRAFANRCDTELSRLDYTILNAGVSPINFH
nr:short chain dehydrogenase sol3 [Quercus suber]